MTMQVIQYGEAFVPPHATALALGCFDGVHLAHRAILQQVLAGKAQGLTPAVFTFPSPMETKQKPELMTLSDRLAVFESLGIELVFLTDFPAIRNQTPEAFIRQTVKEQCRAKRLCCGYNFHFGKDGKGNPALLQTLCPALGISLCMLNKLSLDGERVSSTRIRGLLQEGDIETANTLLGAPYSIAFPVVHGKALGRTIGVPTMNQVLPKGFIQPKKGVYATTAVIDGKQYPGLTNIGVNPTVGEGNGLTVETWVQNFSGDLYGKTVRITFLHFLREERKFASLEALKAQILQDQRQALALW